MTTFLDALAVLFALGCFWGALAWIANRLQEEFPE